MIFSHYLLVACFLAHVSCLIQPAVQTRSRTNFPLYSSSGNEELDAMRKMLASSWDSETMGQVPSDPTIAANEALSSIITASNDGIGVFFVDLLLPAYDVTQGSNLYDEVLAVEYCIALANCLKGKSSIVVRDDKALETVGRILEARERDRQGNAMAVIEDEDRDDTDLDNDDDDDEDAVDNSGEDSEADGGSAASIVETPTADVDSFRQQLMAGWDDSEASADDDNVESSGTPDEPTTPKPKPIEPQVQQPKTSKLPEKGRPKRHRLASMFGNARISQGADMMQNVVEALRANALPENDEENLIVLSAVNREEMIAVRSLVAKYNGQKKIVLVNCKLDPIPRELFGAETVYSILPLTARQKGSEPPDASNPQQKIVVLRRYPKDWEVFVDVGRGFELAEKAPSDLRNKRGPPMEWIVACVQRFLESKV